MRPLRGQLWHGDHHELRDPLAGTRLEGFSRIGVVNQHFELPPVPGVDQAR